MKETPANAEGATAAAPPPPAAPGPGEPGASRRALVAEDSIASRIYLVRLLEQHGYVVRAVPDAVGLRDALAEGPWAIVCVDAALHDLTREAGLSELAQLAAGAARIALVRDAEDEATARAHGFDTVLRKPYERDALERLLARLADGDRSSPPTGAPGRDPDPREWGAR